MRHKLTPAVEMEPGLVAAQRAVLGIKPDAEATFFPKEWSPLWSDDDWGIFTDKDIIGRGRTEASAWQNALTMLLR